MQNNSKQISYRCGKCNSLIQTTDKYLRSKICFSCNSKKVDISLVSVDIHNLVKKLNRRPSLEDYLDQGKYPISIVYKVFAKKEWDEILASLGYRTPNPKNSYTYQNVVEEVERVSKQLKHFPSLEEYNQVGKIDADTVKRATKTINWLESLAVIFNLPTHLIDQAMNSDHSYYQEQLTKLKSIANKLKRSPTREEATKYGVSVDLLTKRLNKKWIDLLKLAEIDVATEVNSLNLTNRLISKEEMLKDLNLVAAQIGYYPSELKYDLLGSYLSTELKYRFDKSWFAVIELAKSHNQELLAKDSVVKEKSSLNKTILEFLDKA
jgi:hypothetical protein